MAEPYLLSVPYAQERETRMSPRYDWKNDRRGNGNYVILQQTLRGCGRFEMDGAVHEVGSGRVFLALVPERSRYYYPTGGREPWEFRWLNFYGELSVRVWSEFRRQFGPSLPLPVRSPANRVLSEIFQLVASQRHPDPFLVGEMAYQFYLAWWQQLQLQQPMGRYADPVAEAEKFCRQHFRRPLAVKEIASHVGLTREHFTRLFRQRHAEGPATYLRELRLQEARRLRREHRLPLAELALRTGFPSARQLGKLLR